jgi:hypothetical protein
MAPDPRRAAQHRADRIRAFREELSALTAEAANPLSADQEAAIVEHHDRLLERLALDFDVDRSARSGQLSRGLRLASFFGAVTLVAAITSLVQRFWGGFTLPTQVTLLTMFPLVSLAAVQIAAERERTRYVASLMALVAVGTAWVAIAMTARLLDIPFSALLLWPGTAFGLALAASYGFRWVLALSLVSLVVAVASVFFAAGGVPWPVLFERLEPLGGAALVLTVLARHFAPAGEGFEPTARLTALTLLLGTLLVLATVSGTSLLAFAPATALIGYQAAMLIGCLVALWRRLEAGDQAGVHLATAFLAVFLVIRYVDWFWEALPAWAFFLVLAAGAFASIAVLRRLRTRLEAA